mgnify:CR=1 FL=1|tara:strand:+ start:28 stop:528 length:501 start_codon:yes stop_codon:yes gene_type:complete
MYTYRNQWTNHFPQDFNKALNSAVGFDNMIQRLFEVSDAVGGKGSNNYPPYNLIKEDDTYTLEMALAGFHEDQLEVKYEEGTLTVGTVKGWEQDLDEDKYVHRGIAARTFTRTFTLSDDVVVKGADFKNGLLIVTMERIVPDEKKARTIPIGSNTKSESQLLTEDK